MSEPKPPWIVYPDFPPYDTFWRQSGECYLKYVWEPYWLKLSENEQAVYLEKWPPPKKWYDFYLDDEYRKMLQEIDDEE